MSYDPCGTQRLEGDDIIKRLALYLKVNPVDLVAALKFQATLSQAARENLESQEKKIEDGGCGCGD